MALSMILLLVGGAELGLRLAGWPKVGAAPTTPKGYESDYLLVMPGVREDLLEHYTDDQGRKMVRTGRQMVESRFMHDLSFTKKPAEGVKRIFCLGGSATFGVPHENEPGLPFPDRVEHYLTEGGVKAEVFNLGGASFGSDQVLDLADQLMDLGAAAIVVYSANNEFFNYHMKLLERNRGFVFQDVVKIRLVHAMRELLGMEVEETALEPTDKALGPEERQRRMVAAVLQDTFSRHGKSVLPERKGGRMIRRDPHHNNVVSRYESNMKKLLELAAKAKPSPLVVLAEVPAYLLHKPWLSIHSPGVDTEKHAALMERGELLLRVKNEAPTAIKVLTEATEMDPTHAMGHFLLARAFLANQEPAKAVAPLRDALELDMEQGRPVAAFGKVVRRLAKENGALWVNIDAELKQDKDPRRGRGFFHDSCHLTERGYDVLGKAVADALAPKLKPVTATPPDDTEQ